MIMKFEVKENHLFFEQMTSYILLTAGCVGAFNMFKLMEKIVRLQDGEQEGLGEGTQLSTGSLTLLLVNHRGRTTVGEFHRWISYIAAFKGDRPDRIMFRTDFDADYSAVKDSEKYLGDGTMRNADFLEPASCSAIGMAYESSKDILIRALGPDPTCWPVELQFFRHARNASFHRNTFDIRPYQGQNTIDESDPPRWRSCVIPSALVDGSRFMNDFFPCHMVLPFLCEIGALIDKL